MAGPPAPLARKQPPMLKIKIRQHTFTLPHRYASGATITLSPAEAQAFNQLFAENIRNNVDALVIKATAILEPGQFLSQETHASLQTEIFRYATEYQFQYRHVPKPKMSPMDVALQEVAEERAREDGLVEISVEWQSTLEHYKMLESVQEEAARRAKAKADVITAALSELF